jgi:thiol-disulfide isomerase/thioredoxin
MRTLLAVVAALAAASMSTAKITVGSAAPPLKVQSWVSGPAVAKFTPGQVYVVEFWATWCAPCRDTIPHLSKLQAKYKGRATFIGVSVSERMPSAEQTRAKVARFVNDMGAKMAYRVATDTQTGAMGKTWMDASGEEGIPTAFIVDQNGKIAWIGHPMDQLDSVLQKVVDRKWDVAAEARRRAEAQRVAAAEEKLMAPIVNALRAGNTEAAVEEVDKVLQRDPKQEPKLAMMRFNLLLQTDEREAQRYASKLSTGLFVGNSEALNELAWSIIDPEGSVQNPDYPLALRIAKRAAEVSKFNDAYILDTLALAYFRTGDTAAAVRYQEQAVAKLPKDADAATRKELGDRLTEFKRKRNGGA